MLSTLSKMTCALLVTGLCVSSVLAKNVNEAEVLQSYMVEKGLDIDKMMDRKTWIPEAEYVMENLSKFSIIDIRQGDLSPNNGIPDFKDGHIPGAMNTSYENILDFVRSKKLPDNILVVSEDGQSAAAAALALRMAGYPNSKTLKFGMSSWNSKFDAWTTRLSSFALENKNWTKEAAPAPKTFSSKPVINTGKETGKEILEARIKAFLAKGYQGITPGSLVNDSKYYAINIGTEKAYGQYGRVKGDNSVRFEEPMIKPKKEGVASLSNLPADKPLALYCWTGHTAIVVASWLDILGYDAKGVNYGVNAMYYDIMKAKKFKKPGNRAVITAN